LSWLIYVGIFFFSELVTDLSVLKYELSLYSLCLFLSLYGYSKIYLVFFSGDLIEGCVENKPVFFVVTVSFDLLSYGQQ